MEPSDYSGYLYTYIFVFGIWGSKYRAEGGMIMIIMIR